MSDRLDSEEDSENVAALGLGELADLTVFNEADNLSYDVRFFPSCFSLSFSSCHVAAELTQLFADLPTLFDLWELWNRV